MKRKYDLNGLLAQDEHSQVTQQGIAMQVLDIECLDEGSIVHMCEGQTKKDIWYCIRMNGSYYLVGLSPDTVGQMKGGHEDLRLFRKYVEQFNPWIYRHETHQFMVKPKNAIDTAI